MCRFISFKISEPRYFNYIAYSLSYISLIDPLLPIKVPNVPSHVDGWGLSAYDSHGILTTFKSSRPFYLDIRRVLRILEDLEPPIYGLIHIRRASTDQPIGAVHSHPYIGEVNGALILMAHNGGLNKELIKKYYNLDINVNEVTDSYVYFYLLLKTYKNIGDILTSIENIIKGLISINAVKLKYGGTLRESSLNAVLLFIKDDRSIIYVIEDWKHLRGELRKYYRILTLAKDKNVIICSSSIAERLRNFGFTDYKPDVVREVCTDNRLVRILAIK